MNYVWIYPSIYVYVSTYVCTYFKLSVGSLLWLLVHEFSLPVGGLVYVLADWFALPVGSNDVSVIVGLFCLYIRSLLLYIRFSLPVGSSEPPPPGAHART